MKQYLLMAVGAVALSSAIFQPANAQSSAGAGAASQSTSGAIAGAGAQAGAVGIQVNTGSSGGVGAQTAGAGAAGNTSLFSPVGLGLGGGSSSGSSSSSSNQNIVGSGNTYNYEAPDLGDTVPTLFIPNLTTSNGTCMGSLSSGISVSGFGGGFGKTYTSEECNARFNANQMNALKAPGVAYEIMCGLDSVYNADMRSSVANGTVPRCASRDEASIDPVAYIEPVEMKWFEQDPLTGAYSVIDHETPDVAANVTHVWGIDYPETNTEK